MCGVMKFSVNDLHPGTPSPCLLPRWGRGVSECTVRREGIEERAWQRPEPGPRLFYLGFTHQHAGIEVRERLRCDDAEQQQLLRAFADLGEERLILGTCERFEIYAYTTNPESKAWLARLAEESGLKADTLAEQGLTHEAASVALHLFRVAAGLESRIVGEPQILSQVRRAFSQAAHAGAAGPILSALLRSAIHTGKRVRREGAINIEVRSSATLAVDHVERYLRSLQSGAVMVVGSGRLARDVLVVLGGRRTGRLLVASRDEERAVSLACKFRGEGLGIDGLTRALELCDAVIACSAAPRFSLVPSSIVERRDAPLVIVDLGVPRNVDPAVAAIPGVHLAHLDQLVAGQPISAGGVAAAETIINEELERFLSWQRARRAAPAICELLRTVKEEAATKQRGYRRLLHRRILDLKDAVAA